MLRFFNVLFLMLLCFSLSYAQTAQLVNTEQPAKKHITPIKFMSEKTIAQLNTTGATLFVKDFAKLKRDGRGYAPSYAKIFTEGEEFRETFTANSLGLLLTDVKEKKSGENWIELNRETYTYDTKGNMLSYIYEQKGEFPSKDITRYEYNATDDLILQTSFAEVAGTEVAYARYAYTYDANHNMLTQTAQNASGIGWIDNWRSLMTYDAKSNLVLHYSEKWLNNAWVNDGKYVYTYDANGNNITFSYQYWQNNAWVYMFREENGFDDKGNMTSRVNYYWNDTVFVPTMTTLLTYDSFNQVLTNKRLEYLDGSWKNMVQESYVYGGKGLLQIMLVEIGSGNDWVLSTKKTYEHDSFGNTIKAFGYVWIPFMNIWSPTYSSFQISYNYSEDVLWMDGVSAEIFYNPVGIEDNELPNSFSLNQNYPNPFNPSTEITFSLPNTENVTLKVYSLLGAEVVTLVNTVLSPGEHSAKFDAHYLPSGVYFYKLETPNFTQTKKMVLLK